MSFPQGSVPGIDVSHYQGLVDWGEVAAGGELFAYCKATEGAGVVDAYLPGNWSGIKQAGLLRGAYHFFHPDQDATAQANNFLAALAKVNGGTAVLAPGDLPPTLDLEVTGSLVAADVLAAAATWLGLVAAATGRTPVVYTFFSFWSGTLGNPKALAEYPLWIARYTSAPSPGVIGGWPTWTFWQYSQSGTVNGIGGPVDVDAFQGAAEDLNALAGF
jgi:lysozyme